MFRKSDRIFKRRVRVWELLEGRDESIPEYVHRETWWFLWLIPLYSRDTIINH